MAYKLITELQYSAMEEFICDTEADVANLPKCSCGSSARVIDTGNLYVVNASCKWTLMPRSGGGGNNDELESALDDIIALQESYIGGVV